MAAVVSNSLGFPSFHSIDSLLGPQNAKLGSQQPQLRIPDPSLHSRDHGIYGMSSTKTYSRAFLYEHSEKSEDEANVLDPRDSDTGLHGCESLKPRKDHHGMHMN